MRWWPGGSSSRCLPTTVTSPPAVLPPAQRPGAGEQHERNGHVLNAQAHAGSYSRPGRNSSHSARVNVRPPIRQAWRASELGRMSQR